MPQKLAWLQRKIDENRHNLLYYFLFLRLTPVVPNWFLNASSSVVGVPFNIFFVASLFGLLPYTIILIKTGLMLDEVSTIGFDFNVRSHSLFDLYVFSIIEHAYTFWPGFSLSYTDLPHQERRQNECRIGRSSKQLDCDVEKDQMIFSFKYFNP